MKVRTFDMLTGEMIECRLVRIQDYSELATLETEDGKQIVRKLSRCEYKNEDLEEYWNEMYKGTKFEKK